MFEPYMKSILLFFYYLFLEEKIVLKATHKVLKKQKESLAQLQKQNKTMQDHYNLQEQKSNQEINTPISLLISSCLQVWRKYQKYSFLKNKNKQILNGVSHNRNFIHPVDLGPWCDFLREAEDEVVLVVILSKILLFSDKDIARGMKTSIGTVRYRLGYGLRYLGSMSPPGVEFIGVESL